MTHFTVTRLEANSQHLPGVHVCISGSASLENLTQTRIKKARDISVKTCPQWSLGRILVQGLSLEDLQEVSDRNSSWGELNRKKHSSCLRDPRAEGQGQPRLPAQTNNYLVGRLRGGEPSGAQTGSSVATGTTRNGVTP